jgi:hypothetical protein
MTPQLSRDVSRAFEAFPMPVRRRLLEVRKLIFTTAAACDGVGPLLETLKWGEPAYLTQQTGSGSTIRLGQVKDGEQRCAVLFNCRDHPDRDISRAIPRRVRISGEQGAGAEIDGRPARSAAVDLPFAGLDLSSGSPQLGAGIEAGAQRPAASKTITKPGNR